MTGERRFSERESSILDLYDAISGVREQLRRETNPRRRQELHIKLRGLEDELQELEAGPGATQRKPFVPKVSENYA